MDISIPYYEDNTRISNSNIGWFLKKGPRYLKDMLDGKIEGLKASFLDKGTMIHEYILQPEEFWNDYKKKGIDFVMKKYGSVPVKTKIKNKLLKIMGGGTQKVVPIMLITPKGGQHNE